MINYTNIILIAKLIVVGTIVQQVIHYLSTKIPNNIRQPYSTEKLQHQDFNCLINSFLVIYIGK